MKKKYIYIAIVILLGLGFYLFIYPRMQAISLVKNTPPKEISKSK